jgi:hypothetical protein
MGSRKFLWLLLVTSLQIVQSLGVQAIGANAQAGTNGQSTDPTQTQGGARSMPCSTAEFPYFFRVFVRGLDDLMPRSAVRAAHVWKQVEIRSYQNPSQLIKVVPQKDYDDFRIGLLQNLWIYLDPTLPNYSDKYPRLQVKFKTITSQKVRVEYQKAEYVPANNGTINQERLVKTFGPPGAYIFEHRNGCWHLTQDLR